MGRIENASEANAQANTPTEKQNSAPTAARTIQTARPRETQFYPHGKLEIPTPPVPNSPPPSILMSHRPKVRWLPPRVQPKIHGSPIAAQDRHWPNNPPPKLFKTKNSTGPHIVSWKIYIIYISHIHILGIPHRLPPLTLTLANTANETRSATHHISNF